MCFLGGFKIIPINIFPYIQDQMLHKARAHVHQVIAPKYNASQGQSDVNNLLMDMLIAHGHAAVALVSWNLCNFLSAPGYVHFSV